jgi:aldehyde dehydrogenase (NAD+)
VSFSGLDIDKLFINGELVDAEGGAVYPNINPATEESLGNAADGQAADVEKAIAAARTAFDETEWSTDRAFRIHCLRQLHQALVDHADGFKEMATAEVGLPTQIAGSTFDSPVEILKWNTDLLESYDFTEDLGIREMAQFKSRRWIEREAYGVVAAITPWNQPTQVNLAKISPALAAGCTVILKGAPTTPWLSAALGKLVAEHTDIPPGVFNVLTGQTNTLGNELLSDPRVDMVSFTGSTAVGRHIMSEGSGTLKKLFLELGGKSAAIVLDDADLATAVMMPGYMCVLHGAQGCATLSRLVLPRAKFDEGVEMVSQLMASMPYGDPTDPINVMGPLNSERHRDRVEAMVNRAKDAGGKPVIGGNRATQFEKGYYFEPTVFANMPEDAEIVRDEVFGPVLVCQPHDGDEDAIRIANDSIFGLSGAVYSGDHERSKEVARKIRAGTMIVDGGIYYGPDAPFGGYKQSGFGREMGLQGFEEYLNTKTLSEPVD